MVNENKVVTAGPCGFTVYYVECNKHFSYKYHQPLLPYLQNLQLFGDAYVNGKRYQQFDKDVFNPIQSRLYKNAVYGLGSYSIDELRRMDLNEKVMIRKKNQKAQRVLNQWKQELVCDLTNDFFLSLFPRSKFVKEMIATTGDFTHHKEVNHLNFAELNITKIQIAQKLVDVKILPDDFFNIAA